MEPDRLSTLLHGGVVLAIAAGIGLILRAGSLLTGVGVVLVIAGLIGLMPALRFQLASDTSGDDEWGTG